MFAFDESSAEWKPISTAPSDRDVELAIIDGVASRVFGQ